jgi:hypothetical protein
LKRIALPEAVTYFRPRFMREWLNPAFSLNQTCLLPCLSKQRTLPKINLRRSHPPNSEMSPRELNRMQSELRAAREHAQLLNVLHRNRIF